MKSKTFDKGKIISKTKLRERTYIDKNNNRVKLSGVWFTAEQNSIIGKMLLYCFIAGILSTLFLQWIF